MREGGREGGEMTATNIHINNVHTSTSHNPYTTERTKKKNTFRTEDVRTTRTYLWRYETISQKSPLSRKHSGVHACELLMYTPAIIIIN